MTILSTRGFWARYIAFGRAKVWLSVTLSCLFFASYPAFGTCAKWVTSGNPAVQPRFVDFARLERLSEAELDEAIRETSNSIKKAAPADIALLSGLAGALDRVKSRRQTGVSAAAAIAPKKFELKVRGKSERELLNEIMSFVKTQPREMDNMVLRYFTMARHDLTALHGTDLYGVKEGDPALFDEQGELSLTIKEQGLARDDGFHAATPEFFFNHYLDPQRIRDGVGRIEEFQRGEQAIVIYDGNNLVDYQADYFTFERVNQKAQTVLAIILPVNQ